MAEIRDQILTGDLMVDGQVYVSCTFREARLIYEGGVPPGFDNCAFETAHFVFQGPAGNTLNFLRGMAPARTHMRQVVLGLIPELNT